MAKCRVADCGCDQKSRRDRLEQGAKIASGRNGGGPMVKCYGIVY